jgi:hypothetical protein
VRPARRSKQNYYRSSQRQSVRVSPNPDEEIANHNPLLLRILSYEQNSPLRTWRSLFATRAAQTNAAVSGPGSNASPPGSDSPTDASAYRFMGALTHRLILPLNCSALTPIAIEVSLTHRLRASFTANEKVRLKTLLPIPCEL